MTELAELAGVAAPRGRSLWLTGTVALTAASFVLAIALAPAGDADPGAALQWLLFTGSSVHVAATGWLYTVPEIRGHVRRHPARYVVAPLALIGGTALAAIALPPATFRWLLLPFFAWQFFHFQKQNLGMAALAGVSHGAGPVPAAERRAIVAAGCAGTAGLLARPQLLQLEVDLRLDMVFAAAAAVFAASVVAGLVLLARRPAGRRPVPYAVVYTGSLLFFAPVFLFESPYAAVAGLILAHGYQYLLILGLVAGGGQGRGPRFVAPAVLLNIGLLGGLALASASHLHDAPGAGRAVYGAYLGVVMAHFVIDAGIWRLRDEFPRRFMTERLPYLLDRPRV